MPNWDSLSITNAMIGLSAAGDPSWPSPLAAKGYQLWGLETTLRSDAGECCADFILHSRAEGTTLVTEAKCGAVKESQHGCYAALAPADLSDGVGVPNTSAEGYCLDVCYATAVESAEKVLEGLARFGQMPAIVFGPDSILRQGPKAFTDEFLEALFGGGIAIDGCDPPMQFLPFDLGSRDATVARAVLTQVVADLRAGRGPTVFDDFMEDVVPVWKLIGQKTRKGYVTRVRSILRGAPTTLAALYELRFATEPHMIVFNEDLSSAGAAKMSSRIAEVGGIVTGYLEELEARDAQGTIYELDGA